METKDSTENVVAGQHTDIDWLYKKEIRVSQVDPAVRVRARITNRVPGDSTRICNEMIRDMTPTALRVLGFLFQKILKQWYDAIYVNRAGIERVRALQRDKKAILFLPTHRSHMDYCILTYISALYDLELPRVVAGDNLNFPLVGSVLGGSGAVFIRREFGSDTVYKQVFKEYLRELLKAGSTVECFVEGGRSRSGKLLSPKAGVVKSIVEILEEELSMDVYIIPIAISYDKVAEGNSLVQELLGSSKEKESFAGFLKMAKSMLAVKLNLGTIDIRFGNPFSLRDSIRRGQKYGAPSGVFDDHLQRTRFALRLSHRVLFDCNAISTISPTSLVATVLLTANTRGMPVHELVERVDSIKKQLMERGARVSKVFETKPSDVAVRTALNVLGSRLVKNRNDILFGYSGIEGLELSIYRNQIMHWFVSECSVACAFVSLCPGMFTSPNPSVPFDALLESVRFTSKLLKHEFIFKKTPDITDSFQETLALMQCRKILVTKDGVVSMYPAGVGRRGLGFLCALLWPYMDIYWVTCLHVGSLDPDLIIAEDQLISRICRDGEDLYYQEKVSSCEVASTVAVKSAVHWCLSEGFLVSKRVDGWKSKNLRLYQLCSTSHDDLKDLTSQIERFRRSHMNNDSSKL